MTRTERREPGYVLLEDGTRFDGELCAASASITGEVVFNTSMTGYQEAVTDPSYAGQIITFTYPLIGNYGVSDAAMESDRAHARGVIMREGKNSPGAPGTDARGGWLDWLSGRGTTAVSGIDTRALVRHIRDRGAMRGGIFPASTGESEARERVAAEPEMAGADLARTVAPDGPVELGVGEEGPHVVALDTGIKRSIIRQFRQRGCRVTLLPCTSHPEAVLERDPDLVFLANGPGDPAALDYVVETTRELVGKRPVVGICLGHQLLSRAVGLDTFKLRFGHRGTNHPVKELAAGRIDITSQNHGFAVRPPDGGERIEADEPVRWETDFGTAELSHLNLYDRTVEGIELRDVPGCAVQYHPEAGPGPHDARHLFDRFLELAAPGEKWGISRSFSPKGGDAGPEVGDEGPEAGDA
jgi:carbamoyl-phosphate synthase small subunit